jgi:TatD DNase family protein
MEEQEEKEYVDAHCHILAEEFQADFDGVMERIRQKNIIRMALITSRPEEAERAIALAAADSRFDAAYGIHPEDVRLYNEESFRRFEELAENPQIHIIGEIGLDYHWEKETKELQQELFIRQIETANRLHKPVNVHSRDAMQDTFDILKAHPCRGSLHSFSGSAEMAVEFTKLGYYISLGGPVTFKNARHSREVAAAVDEHFLLSETDCPYMAPEPVRGTRNEPSNIPYIAAAIAAARGTDMLHMTRVLKENYDRLFREGR